MKTVFPSLGKNEVHIRGVVQDSTDVSPPIQFSNAKFDSKRIFLNITAAILKGLINC
jgi:hypothetical protein